MAHRALALAAVVFICERADAQPGPALGTATRPAGSQPADPETVAAARARLVPPRPAARPAAVRPSGRRRGRPPPAPDPPTRASSTALSEPDLALLAVLDLTLAIGRDDQTAVAALIDAVGYQALPLTGELPDKPPKPVAPDEIRSRVGSRRTSPLDRLPVRGFRVLSREAVRPEFPAVADWMLATDWAVVVEPAHPDLNWVTQSCCVVVRLRARKPSILGGNLFEALGPR